MSVRRTYYQILMVDPAADLDIIALVHRRLAQRYHPDVDPSPEARQRMAEINTAYDTLKSPERRARYDAELTMRRDRRSSDRFVRRPTEVEVPPPASEPGKPAAPASPYGEAGPPRGPARGSVLDFGRYRGWSLGQIAAHDPDFLLWLERSPAGRQYRVEIGQILGSTRR
jgi:curved DNA-binding protein CbpA